jgi:hypothetical protein
MYVDVMISRTKDSRDRDTERQFRLRAIKTLTDSGLSVGLLPRSPYRPSLWLKFMTFRTDIPGKVFYQGRIELREEVSIKRIPSYFGGDHITWYHEVVGILDSDSAGYNKMESDLDKFINQFIQEYKKDNFNKK